MDIYVYQLRWYRGTMTVSSFLFYEGQKRSFILLLNRLRAALIRIEIAASCMNRNVMYKNFDFRLGDKK